MKFRLKGNKIKDLPEQLIYLGRDALNIPSGSIVKVLISPSKNDLYNILARTNSFSNPFIVALNTTGLSEYKKIWGSSISGYKFKIIPFDTIERYGLTEADILLKP